MDGELADLASYKLPKLELLTEAAVDTGPLPGELDAVKQKIVNFFTMNQIGIERIKAIVGPTATVCEITPSPGIRVAKIKSLQNDLALYLAAHVNITGPIPGKGALGIEVYHSKPIIVFFRSLLASEKFLNSTMDLPIAIGRSMDNDVVIADLTQMPHLLIAGAKGKGKSMFLHNVLLSLLYKKHPAELKLVLIDVKNLEFAVYRKVERHFLAKSQGANSISGNVSQALQTLESLIVEMDQRYELLKDAGLRQVKEYNQKFIDQDLNNIQKHRYLPFIVVVIDEFADLITADKNVDRLLGRLAQSGRPVGIHLVIATQRPSANIITGIVKVNFTTRLAFGMSSSIDSKTVLDKTGAEALTGNGDCLLLAGSDLVRLQTALISSDEIEKVCDFIGHQAGYQTAMLLPGLYDNAKSRKAIFDLDDIDPFFEEAAHLIVIHQQGLTSLIQRKLKLGYNRAGRIMDQLESAGIVGPFDGRNAREVIIKDQLALEQKINALLGRTIIAVAQQRPIEIVHPEKKGIWRIVAKLFK